jgi:hypothetical protein
MRRAFDLDVLRRPCCAGRMPLMAVIHRILANLGLPRTRDDPQPPCSVIEPGSEQRTLPGVTV